MYFSTLLLSSLAIFAVSAAPTPGDGYGSGSGGGGSRGSGDGSGGDGGSGTGGSSVCPQQQNPLCCNTELPTTNTLGGLVPIGLSLPDLLDLGCSLQGIIGSGSCNVQAACCTINGNNDYQVCTNTQGATFNIPISIPIDIPINL